MRKYLILSLILMCFLCLNQRLLVAGEVLQKKLDEPPQKRSDEVSQEKAAEVAQKKANDFSRKKADQVPQEESVKRKPERKPKPKFKPKEYRWAVRDYRRGSTEFALMGFRQVMEKYPDTHWAKQSMFALAEIYFNWNNYSDAANLWIKYIKDYPTSKEALLARIYLILALNNTGDSKRAIVEQLTEQLKKELFSRPVFLGFSEYKTYLYQSALGNKYELREFIDRIEIYLNEKLFYQILP